jgi:hypothetical protein
MRQWILASFKGPDMVVDPIMSVTFPASDRGVGLDLRHVAGLMETDYQNMRIVLNLLLEFEMAHDAGFKVRIEAIHRSAMTATEYW